jgi:hypothetical protein
LKKVRIIQRDDEKENLKIIDDGLGDKGYRGFSIANYMKHN